LENLCVKKKFISNNQSLEKIEFFLFNQAFITSGQKNGIFSDFPQDMRFLCHFHVNSALAGRPIFALVEAVLLGGPN
jgi:hypothetical protein